MAEITVRKVKGLKGSFTAPADKSISQRAIMLSAVAEGKTRLSNVLDCDDCRCALNAFRDMGVPIAGAAAENGLCLEITGTGMRGLVCAGKDLYLGNSGTTMRLLPGILAGQKFSVTLKGDSSLSKRPMKRITAPLRRMGADIKGRTINSEEYPPLTIKGGNVLSGINYRMPLSSAQVKSVLLLAGTHARGTTTVWEKLKTRDHTERMLRLFGARLQTRGLKVSVRGDVRLQSPGNCVIPGDISSCAFFIAAAALVRGSSLFIGNVGLNPTRTYFLSVLKRMGADITVVERQTAGRPGGEPWGTIRVRAGALRAVNLSARETAYCIDELPVLFVAAAAARGTARIRSAAELRVKETDRIRSMTENLRRMGARIRTKGSDIVITGVSGLHGAVVDSFGDHRTAMSMCVAGLLAEGKTVITNTDCINKSFPRFRNILEGLIRN